ncbi:FliI/YscN family ATPase [Vibrio alginolyticus]|uniref:FliI/YscN family ATPase n=1 Tax=Vibrio alginolyticus TaxID=663 RepID=UPI0006CA6B5B|nr:FliI/YscN family ATPase [Vibrio alginolyticus]KPM98591.1 hypothetical protein AOG25_09145 [Vibrio alginolyticus]CAH7157923.1 Flagellum-specific ATP synthase [Vibrio chagasii]CAH7327423.1 Flagellum-specific ATP synthase [Vibrio chagasii]
MKVLDGLSKRNQVSSRFTQVGRVKNVSGITVEVEGLSAPLGARCAIETNNGLVMADVVGFEASLSKLQPLSGVEGINPNSKVSIVTTSSSLPFSEDMLGTVIDPCGNILIGKDCTPDMHLPLTSQPLSISERGEIDRVFKTGIKAIDTLTPIGFGQRIGLFAGTGVGKSVTLAMITQFSSADVVVVGLIGERGREVSDFAMNTLSSEARKKSVIVAAPADYSPILRMQGAEAATAIAEHYRDKGLNVLLLIDSVSRYAIAQREVAGSAGEPPTTKGYPPSVFAKLPFLIERAGAAKAGGSITAIYTVLAEGDDLNGVIIDAARGVLDGHVVLSRAIAEKGIYPAIDIPKSISRLAQELLSKDDYSKVLKVKGLFSLLADNHDLVSLGLIEPGKNPELDLALDVKGDLDSLVKQDIGELSNDSHLRQTVEAVTRRLSTLRV